MRTKKVTILQASLEREKELKRNDRLKKDILVYIYVDVVKTNKGKMGRRNPMGKLLTKK